MRLRLVLIFLLGLIGLTAQSQEGAQRPKVGLALSGGSAHGLAHIGVLKYMEELGIEVDYITGTSMGSVVGGLYSMGFTADEIADIAEELDWDQVMSNRIPLYEIAPIEKPYHGRIPLSALWQGSSFRLPRGFIRGQKLDLVISKVYCPARHVDDFDDFHIPFRCVAVDIEDGSVDVLDKGYVGDAIRASMAIPTVFPPKELNGRLYVDGGLIRNFPVEEAKDMGADIVIGVYVGSMKSSRDELFSMFDILKQSASMGNLLDSDKQKSLADILIEPDVKDEGTFDFDQSKKFIQLGYEAAKAQSDMFIKLAAKLKNFPPKGPRPARLDYPDVLRLTEINIPDADKAYEKMILNRIDFEEGFALPLDRIEESLSLIYGTKNFSKTAYSFY